jgi:hypothetical protein
VYGWLADELRTDAALQNAVEIVRFEDLCDSAYATLEQVLSHCELDDARLLTSFAERIQAPRYYEPSFSGEEETILADETGAVAERFGYHAVEKNADTMEPRRFGRQVSSSQDCR